MQIGYRIFFFLIIVACALTFLHLFITTGIFLLQHNPKAMDFLAFYTGSQLLSHAPNALYNVNTQLALQRSLDPAIVVNNTFLPFLNPPFVGLLFVPLLGAGLLNAYGIWTGLNCIFLILICYFAYRETTLRTWHKILFIIAIITFIPILTTLLIGQLSILLSFIFLGAWLLLKKKREFYSGLVLSLLLIKPHFLLIPFIAILFQRRKKMVQGVFIGVLFLLFVSYLSVGFNGILSYINFINNFYQFNNQYGNDLLQQHNLQALFLILFHTESLSVIRIPWIITSLLIIVPTLFFWSKKFSVTSVQCSYQYTLLLFATLLTSPHTHFHDISFFVVIAVLLFSIVRKQQMKHTPSLLVLLILGYTLELFLYVIDVQTKNHFQQEWIVINVLYFITFWLLLAKHLATFWKKPV